MKSEPWVAGQQSVVRVAERLTRFLANVLINSLVLFKIKLGKLPLFNIDQDSYPLHFPKLVNVYVQRTSPL